MLQLHYDKIIVTCVTDITDIKFKHAFPSSYLTWNIQISFRSDAKYMGNVAKETVGWWGYKKYSIESITLRSDAFVQKDKKKINKKWTRNRGDEHGIRYFVIDKPKEHDIKAEITKRTVRPKSVWKSYSSCVPWYIALLQHWVVLNVFSSRVHNILKRFGLLRESVECCHCRSFVVCLCGFLHSAINHRDSACEYVINTANYHDHNNP